MSVGVCDHRTQNSVELDEWNLVFNISAETVAVY